MLKYNVQSGAMFVSTCCHTEHCYPVCITGSHLIARQFTFEEAVDMQEFLSIFNMGKGWRITPVIEEPQTIVIRM